MACKSRDLENTGTCGWCFRNVKLKGGRSVLHGYKRPGWGQVHGRCGGVHYDPYERNTVATERRREGLQESRKGLVARTEEVSAEGFQGTLVDTSWRKPRTFEYGDQGWEMVRRGILGRLKSNLYYLDRDIEFLTQKIDEWHPKMTMPDGTPA